MESEIQDHEAPTSVIQPDNQTQMEEIPVHSKELDTNSNSTPSQQEEKERPSDSALQANDNILNEVGPHRMHVRENLKKYEIKNPSTSSLTSPRDVIKKWEWLPCNYELKKEEKGTETYWSLTPIIQLVNPESKSVPHTDISFDLERPFMYNPEVGWNWHKSWNLPNLTVNLKITDPVTKVPVLPPADLKAQLIAVKVLLHRVEQVKLYDLGLKGSNIQDLSEGTCTFSGVKFSSTSYNNEGVKFHLVVLVYIQEDSRNRACPKILVSKISPPIFVDSRKAARNANIYKNRKINSIYFDSFPPDTFTRTFVKRNSKLNEAKEEIIENSLGGLCQYFTAPNIRNKVKHPIFLRIKFSNCVKLYYNEEIIKQHLGEEEPTEENLIYVMQKIFFENHVKNKGSEVAATNKAFDHKAFVVVIEEPNNPDSFILNKKIADYLEPIINEVLHIMFNSTLLPSQFKLFPTNDLITSYASVYPKLVELKNSFGPIEEYDEYEDSKVSVSKYKGDFSPKESLNVKRERSYSSEEEDDSDEDEEESIAKIAEPKKKVKVAVGSRKSNRKIMEESLNNEMNSREGSVRQTTTKQPKQPKEKKPAKKPTTKKATKSMQESISKKPNTDVKTETEEMNLKSEPDTSSGFYERNSMVSSPGTNKRHEKPATRTFAQPSASFPYQGIPHDLLSQFSDKSSLMTSNLDMVANMQREQQRSEQEKNLLLMNMMYPGRSNQPMQNSSFLDMMQGQNSNMAMYQQQMIQSQLAAQLQQQKQQQYLQLQQQFRFIHEKNGIESEKEKAMQAELALRVAQGDLGLDMHFKAQNQSFGNHLTKNQQFPLLSGIGNLSQISGLQDFNGLTAENNPMMFMNMNKSANMGKRNGMFGMPKPE